MVVGSSADVARECAFDGVRPVVLVEIVLAAEASSAMFAEIPSGFGRVRRFRDGEPTWRVRSAKVRFLKKEKLESV